MYLDAMIENRDKYIAECNGDELKEAQMTTNLLYSAMSNKAKYEGMNVILVKQKIHELIEISDYSLRDEI